MFTDVVKHIARFISCDNDPCILPFFFNWFFCLLHICHRMTLLDALVYLFLTKEYSRTYIVDLAYDIKICNISTSTDDHEYRGHLLPPA